jgi:Neocarzinostatin family
MRSVRTISCLAIVAACFAFGAVPASAVGPTVTATPNTKLADGQQISVSASGFAPNALVAVVECPTKTVSPDACDLNTLNFGQAGSTGAFSNLPFIVSRVLSDGTDCALNGGCYVGTQDAATGGAAAAALITFDPTIPPFTLTARVDKTDAVNTKGVIALMGSVHCGGQGADVDVQVDVRQTFHRSIFESGSEIIVTCAANTTVPFRTTVRPENGLFGPGAAIVRIFAQSGSHVAAHRVNVTLVRH